MACAEADGLFRQGRRGRHLLGRLGCTRRFSRLARLRRRRCRYRWDAHRRGRGSDQRDAENPLLLQAVGLPDGRLEVVRPWELRAKGSSQAGRLASMGVSLARLAAMAAASLAGVVWADQ